MANKFDNSTLRTCDTNFILIYKPYPHWALLLDLQHWRTSGAYTLRIPYLGPRNCKKSEVFAYTNARLQTYMQLSFSLEPGTGEMVLLHFMAH